MQRNISNTKAYLLIKSHWEKQFNPSNDKFNLNFREFDQIIQNYLSEKRFYHNLDHLLHMFANYAEYNQFLSKKSEIVFAIFYHDSIYDPKKNDNEEKSAEWAELSLTKMGFGFEFIKDVKTMILATKSHIFDNNSPIAKDLVYFLDFDLAILGTQWLHYREYACSVRKEYCMYDNNSFIFGRIQFIHKMLQKKSIFLTEIFRTEYEEIARYNFKKESEMLESGNIELI